MSTKTKNINKKTHLILSYLIFIFFILSTFVLLFFIESGNIKIQSENIINREETTLNLHRERIQYVLNSIFSDITSISEIYGERLINYENYQTIEQDWLIISTQKKTYDQIRYLNKEGKELIRINNVDGVGVIVDQSLLQNKSDRYYFIETMKLSKDDMYISKIDLNVENGVVAIPYLPTIRFSMPIYDKFNQRQGMVIINYRADYLIDQLDTLSQTSNGEIEILNSDGYWISNMNKDKEFTFMFEDKLSDSFAQNYPLEWANMNSNTSSEFTNNGFFIYSKINLYQKWLIYHNQTSEGIEEQNWWIVSRIPINYDTSYLFNPSLFVFWTHIFKKYMIMIIFMTFFGALLSALYYRNILNYSKTKYHAAYDGLTRILNRRAGLKDIENYLSTSKDSTASISFCYMDINGLKEVNDRFGHLQGDQLILLTTETILSEIRDTDIFMRLGGDEFLLVLVKTKYEDGLRVWERIQNHFDLINRKQSYPFLISVSHGLITKTQKDIKDINETIKESDQLMYAEKKARLSTMKIFKD